MGAEAYGWGSREHRFRQAVEAVTAMLADHRIGVEEEAETAQIRALELAALKAEERRIAKTRPQSARASSSSITGTGTHTKEYDAMHGVRWPREAEIA